MNLITGTTVGQHWIISGAFLSDNYEVSYELGTLTVTPAPVDLIIDPSSLDQTYDGNAKMVTVNTSPADVALSISYNGSASLPVNANENIAVEVSVIDPNYTGSVTASFRAISMIAY